MPKTTITLRSIVRPLRSKATPIKCAYCFKSLGIPARIKMYHYLRGHGEATVTRLVELVKLTQPTVSYHLKEMRELGLLTSRKSGKEVYYDVNELCPHHECECILTVIRFPGEGVSGSEAGK